MVMVINEDVAIRTVTTHVVQKQVFMNMFENSL